MFGRTNNSIKTATAFSMSLLFFVALVSVISISIFSGALMSEISESANYSVMVPRKAEIEVYQTVRTVTAYNAGDPLQNDSEPCISASGDDICRLLEVGVNVCALNTVPFGTIMRVEDLGDCIVLDRTSSKHSGRLDWAMKANERDKAIKFGRRKLNTSIIYKY